jgi:hypothetical protein
MHNPYFRSMYVHVLSNEVVLVKKADTDTLDEFFA